MKEHTSSPWEVSETLILGNHCDVAIANMATGFCAPSNPNEREANARLITAAPEMLALLEESQRNLTGDWRERRDALLERLNGDEE